MAGLWLDEFSVGQVFDHPLRRTVTETDNLLVSALTHNPAPLHLDAEYMKGTEYGKILVNSCFTLGLMVGISVNDTTQGTAVANLGWDEVRFPRSEEHTSELQSPIDISYAVFCLKKKKKKLPITITVFFIMRKKKK